MSKLIYSYEYHFGHKIYSVGDSNKWYYVDNDEFAGVSGKLKCERMCPRCSSRQTNDGHDPCIKNLPGVIHACCGHGNYIGCPYIMKSDKSTKYFSDFEEMRVWLKEYLDYDIIDWIIKL
jgi:hypothetical protein